MSRAAAGKQTIEKRRLQVLFASPVCPMCVTSRSPAIRIMQFSTIQAMTSATLCCFLEFCISGDTKIDLRHNRVELCRLTLCDIRDE
jgi:hypothetical protein